MSQKPVRPTTKREKQPRAHPTRPRKASEAAPGCGVREVNMEHRGVSPIEQQACLTAEQCP